MRHAPHVASGASDIALGGENSFADHGFSDFNAGIAITEMIGRTNYLALVGGGKQPKFPQNKVRPRVHARSTPIPCVSMAET